ncbi:MAG: hypothetical protein RL038_1261 [Actinomycetota bacterium]|jgi:hypothetical protein
MSADTDLIEVRRHDGEICGYVVSEADQFLALTIFLVPVLSFAAKSEALDFVKERGLDLLQANWFGFIDDEWQLVRIQEASAEFVTVTTDIYGVGDGFSHSFLGATDKLKLADPINPL